MRQFAPSEASNKKNGCTPNRYICVLHLRRYTDRIVTDLGEPVAELSAVQWDRLDPLQRVERLLSVGFLASSCEWLAVRPWAMLPLIVRLRLENLC